jgi:CO/xanthine dehydrogenase FAD-binding subunit
MGDAVLCPQTLEEALAARAAGHRRPVAGGTDLMVKHRPGAPVPVELDATPLFIGRIPELRSFTAGSELRIGSAVTLRELDRHPSTPDGVRELLRWFAAPAIRNVATVGGNICNASPAADLLPWLIAAGATVVLHSVGGERTLPVSEFVTGPGTTVLREDELLTEIVIPLRVDTDAPFWYYRKVAGRRSNALSKLAVYAEACRGPQGTLEEFRLAVGAVAPTVVRSTEAEARLSGRDAEGIREAAPEITDLYADRIHPIDDQRSTATYRRNTALSLIRHILEERIPHYLEQQ